MESRSLENFEFKLNMKNRKIDYLYKHGRISPGEYEKWILSDNIDFEPKIMSAKEVVEKFKLDWGQFHNQSFMWVADPHVKTNQLLEKILEKLEQIQMKI